MGDRGHGMHSWESLQQVVHSVIELYCRLGGHPTGALHSKTRLVLGVGSSLDYTVYYIVCHWQRCMAWSRCSA